MGDIQNTTSEIPDQRLYSGCLSSLGLKAYKETVEKEKLFNNPDY